MTIIRWACALALALLSPLAMAQTTATSVQAPAGWAPMQAPCVKQVDGTCVPVSATNPLPIQSPAGSNGATSTSVSVTVTTAGTYQSALAASSSRRGCLIQNTSTATLKVFLGAPGSATDATALQIAAGGSFSCGAPGGLVVTDQISVTATASAATLVIVSQ